MQSLSSTATRQQAPACVSDGSQRPKGNLFANETKWTTTGIVVTGTAPSGGGGSSTGKDVGIAVGVVAAVAILGALPSVESDLSWHAEIPALPAP